MSKKIVKANKNPNHNLPQELAADHYLILEEKEQWNKGEKISTPVEKFVSINDMDSFVKSRYWEKHQITVEILHDPNLPFEEANEEPPLTAALNPTGKKVKADYVAEYAAILEIPVEAVDKALTIEDLKQLIEEAKSNK